MCASTRKERKICLKIHHFSFPETLVMRHATTAACNVVSFSTLIGRFEFEHALKLTVARACAQIQMDQME